MKERTEELKPKKERPETVTHSATVRSLRDRTDELELIISSLTIFALVTLPGWLFERYSAAYTHLSDSYVIAGTIAILIITGVSYALAACFVVHLMTRAYWIGLIGLRTVFPDGINWGRTPGIGPITKKRFRETLPNLDRVIDRTDRLASSLFAIISLITLSMLWVGVIILITLVIAIQFGARIGSTNASLNIAFILLLIVFAGLPTLLWLLDAQLAARFPKLQNNRFFVSIIKILGRMNSLVFPQRLILPVQLTLQSNTRPVVFLLALFLGSVAIFWGGNARVDAWRNFTVSDAFTYFDTSRDGDRFLSTYYEDMSSPKDRLRSWPRIDSFEQKGRFVTVFLPYHPLRDNLMLEILCPDVDEGAARTECLRTLWSVSLNDKPTSMDNFIPAQRGDLRMRGLIGIVSLDGLSPGLHYINIVWNPNFDTELDLVDDRYSANNLDFRIPIAFMPDYELALDLVK